MRLAHAYVTTAIYHGAIPKLDGSVMCKDCGLPAEEYDHRDYMSPLKVDPVCMSCNQLRGPGKNLGPCEGEERRKTLLQRFREKHGNIPPQQKRRAVGESARITAFQQRRKDAKSRRDVILKLHKKGEKQADIAKAVGLTRERVRQIIIENSAPQS